MALVADNLAVVSAVCRDCNIAVEVTAVMMRMMWPNGVTFAAADAVVPSVPFASGGNLFAALYCHRTYCCRSNRVANFVVASLATMFAN